TSGFPSFMESSVARLSLLGAVLMAASCASAGAATDPLALYSGTPVARQAQLQGRLVLDGACLYIVAPGGERWLAAFPSPGTRWEPGENAVEVGARRVRVGETGGFAGGEASDAPWVKAPDDSCDASKLWTVSTLMDP
ncbi:MAG TPA: hypothetical protein VE913_02120, partial [Longimicrobium sp.]|nr:hypothetical protein [Longimicrobium sp.]